MTDPADTANAEHRHGDAPATEASARPTTASPAARATKGDPLRSSATSRSWLMLVALAVVLVLLVVFVAQNTAKVPLAFLGWSWHPPLAVALLASAAAGLLLAIFAGSLRILQLRRRVHRDGTRTRD